MLIEILCTLGPASFNRIVIERLTKAGATLFRINMSHTKISELESTIGMVRRFTDVPICLDTEGAQIRTGHLIDGTITLREGSTVCAPARRVPGDSAGFNFYPPDIIKSFQVGDLISIDFKEVLVQVISLDSDNAVMRVLSGGVVGQNKAVTVDRQISLPVLTEKDHEAITIGNRVGIKHFALSFANSAADVDEMRSLISDESFVIAKIECHNALKNFDEIALRSDALLIDRGDLSREIPLQQIPRIQKGLIHRSKELGKKIYVATNLLESMVTAPSPTRAEVNDIYTTLADGANGLVLTAETAIGKYPIPCANMIVKMAEEVRRKSPDINFFPSNPFSMLVEPHGGKLVHRVAEPQDIEHSGTLPTIEVDETIILDCAQIAEGVYSPVTGFMNKDTLESVLGENRLPNGTIWTMPILLPIPKNNSVKFGVGDRIGLKGLTGRLHALADVNDIFEMDLDPVAEKWFGTSSPKHPGAARMLKSGNRFIGCDILLVERLPTPYSMLELTPYQTRYILVKKGWTTVVGFHTRNVCHRAHEYIILKALEMTGADGLLISPVTGPKKEHDFLPEPILRSHHLLLDFGIYPRGRTILASFSTFSRYCGPREAVFTALCRKNMGCSHFIVGRDHTGVGEYYGPEANSCFFDQLDIGIEPVFFGSVGYNAESNTYEESNNGSQHFAISGTEIRKALREGNRLPEWYVRDIVQDMLFDELAAGQKLFFDQEARS